MRAGQHVSPQVAHARGVDWRHRAACQGEDAELFFPVGTSGPALLQIAQAKAVCRGCPVVSECLTWALESGQDAGVWGGMSEDERRALKRRGRAGTPPQPVSPPPASRVKAAGRQALREGVSVADVAAALGVTRETARKWARQNENELELS